MRTAFVALTLLTATAQGAWVSLSDSGDLASWTVLSGVWDNVDGIIAGQAKPADPAVLLSNSNYFDFELELEFKTDAPCNGAVAIRAHWLPEAPHLDEDLPIYGYELGVDTQEAQGTAAIVEPNGRGNLAKPAADAMKALKEKDWNTLQISAKGDTIDISLNGVHAVSNRDEAFIGGKLALQVVPLDNDVATIQFRNIRINDIGREGDWTALFNGKDFTGWKEWGSEEWKVEDGIIIGRSGPKKSEGYLATEKTWKDFRVRGSFKMLGEGNFGLFYHSTIKYNDEQYPMISGLQGEVAPGYPSPTGWVYESYKRGWLVKPDMDTMPAFALRPGEWNEIEIRSVGNHVTTWVNGIRVLDLVDEGQILDEGSFALQLHTGGVDGIMWKDIYETAPSKG